MTDRVSAEISREDLKEAISLAMIALDKEWTRLSKIMDEEVDNLVATQTRTERKLFRNHTRPITRDEAIDRLRGYYGTSWLIFLDRRRVGQNISRLNELLSMFHSDMFTNIRLFENDINIIKDYI